MYALGILDMFSLFARIISNNIQHPVPTKIDKNSLAHMNMSESLLNRIYMSSSLSNKNSKCYRGNCGSGTNSVIKDARLLLLSYAKNSRRPSPIGNSEE
jgi:hypothetical protein